jgi:hypothetical protein
MYQRVSQDEVALFHVPSAGAGADLRAPARPERALLATHVGGVNDAIGLEPAEVSVHNDVGNDQMGLVNLSTSKIPGSAKTFVVVSAPSAGPNGERTFVLAKEIEMADAGSDDVDDVASKKEKEGAADRDDAANDYVWDIMVRKTVNAEPNLESALSGPSVFGPNSGRLLLDLNDSDNLELFNQLYQSDEEDEDRVETDDEDENAEGYYGADYPEEEDDDEDEDEDDEDEDEDDDDDYGPGYFGSDDEDEGGGYYNEATGRFSKTTFMDSYNDEVRSMMH